jgi:hypothetical protein
MNVSELISILSGMDDDADVVLFIDQLGDTDGTTELVQLELDDVVIGESYVGFQVPTVIFGGN